MASENTTTPSLSLILPTYNERENIRIFIPHLEEKFKDIPHEIIVVDDSSPDGTGDEVRKLAKGIPNLKLITRMEKTGIGSALRDGYNSATGDIILSSDADLSLSPLDLMKLYQKIAMGDYDLVVGSRYIASSVYETPRFGVAVKFIVSHLGNRMLRLMFHMPIHDFSLNCRAMRHDVWRRVKTEDNGNFFLFEMIYLAQKAHARIGEVPVTFLDRKYGTSKINHTSEVIKAFGKMLLYLLRH